MWELAKGLNNLGNEITVVCSSFKGSKPFDKIDGLQIIRINGSFSLPFKILKYYFKNLKNKYDVVIEEALGGQRLPYFAGLYVKDILFAVWHQKHEKIFYEQYPLPLGFFLSIMERMLANFYRNREIITASEGSKQKLLSLGFSNKRIKVVNDGVGKLFQNPKTDKKRKNIIVCIGKLRRYKRFDQAISIFHILKKNLHQDYRLVIAGKISEIDSNYLEFLKAHVKNLGLEKCVEFRINISEEAKLKLLEKAKVLLQPSPIEGFSIVVIEANRCGTPVVGSDGVPADVLVNEHNGLVYPFGDIETSAKILTKLLSNKNLWKKISKDAISWSKQFTWEKSSENLQNHLSKALSRNNLSCEIK